MMNRLFLLLLIFFNTTYAFCSTNPDLKKGIEEYENDRYHNAIPYLENVLQEDSTNAEAMFKLGVCYLHIFSFEESLELIQQSIKIDPEVDEFSDYWLGKAYHENEYFDEAIAHYEVYLDEYTNEKDTRRIEILRLIEQAKVGKELTENPKYYLIENLGDSINSPFHEHSPILTQDGKTLFFTSQRAYEGHNTQDPDGHYYETIFIAKRKEEGGWSKAKPLGGKLDHHGHDACIQLYDNDSKMIVYRQKKQGDFYVSEKIDGQWQAPKPIEDINTGSYEVDASITSDGKRMYFATDKYTKERHIDLYYSDLTDEGKWGDAISLGENINTIADENAPFISPDGKTLYFCSNSSKSMGGYDIFKTTLQADGSWSTPENLGVPINSMDDDIHFVKDENLMKSYFASHREDGIGELDIFSATPVPFVKINGELISSIDNQLIEDDTIEVVFRSAMNSNFEFNTDDSLKRGKFEPNLISANTYDLYVLKKKDTLYKETMEVALVEGEKNVLDKKIVLDYKVPVETPASPIIALKQAAEPLVVYFDFDNSGLNDSGQMKLDAIFKAEEVEDIQIVITGYTDAKGNEAYNLKLSKRRAKSVEKYLRSLGVDSKYLKTDAKGEADPIATNETDEGRAKNRRVELIIK